MPHHVDLIFTLTGGFLAALLLGLVTHRYRLSPIVGYLLAGILVGPFTPGFVAHVELAEQLAELGVILLMFGVGLHFHVKELLAVQRIALPGALIQIATATGLGLLVAHLAGWGLGAGAVFGLALSIASTVVLLRVLTDNGVLHTTTGHVAVGWLLVEDVFTVLVLVLLPILSGAGAGGAAALALSIGVALLKVGALIAFTLLAGRRAVPALLAYVARTRSRELFTLTVLVLALGIAVGAATLFGASMALGAFLAGMVVGQSPWGARAASDALPMRNAFAVLFFVSMGMLFDPAKLLATPGLTLGTLAVVLIGKPLIALALGVALRLPAAMTATIALALAQIGEFSFILATLGRQLGLLPEAATQALVVASIVSITVSPLLVGTLVTPLAKRLEAWFPRRSASAAPVEPGRRMLVVGHGPVGGTLVKLLRDEGVVATVIEQNAETVRRLLAEGVHAIHGDAADPAVLTEAGIADAGALVLSASGSPDAVIRAARACAPEIRIVTRATYVSESAPLRAAGASVVVSAEGEVALAMTEHLLRGLGASDEQLDRARDRVREELGST